MTTSPLQNLYLFPVFQTREAYAKATGAEPPPFDPTKPVKSWYDPKAATEPRRKLVYDNVLALADNGAPLVDEQGRPYTEPLLIDREDAARVNIPVKDFSGRIQEAHTIGVEIPVPMRALTQNEELFFQFGGTVVAVRNKGAVNDEPTDFTTGDRVLLQAIAAKLGVA